MIILLKEGLYKLGGNFDHRKFFGLDDKNYSIVYDEGLGENLLLFDNVLRSADHLLAIGKYRLYRLEDEHNLQDGEHLELHVGEGHWQGYILAEGLPNSKNKRSSIVPTNEIITKVSFNNFLVPAEEVQRL